MGTRKGIFAVSILLSFLALVFIFANFSQKLVADKAVFTASLVSETPEILDTPEEIVVVEPPPVEVVEIPESVIELVIEDNRQNQIDDLLEKIDLLKRQIADIELQKELALEAQRLALVEEEIIEEEVVNNQPPPDVVVVPAVVTTGGGATYVIYPKILISEILIGSESDSKQEFVELYNPNSEEVDLTEWYLQRKTKTGASFSTFAASNLFLGKKIPALGYFLISREGSSFSFHIAVDHPLTNDNSLALKNPNGEISDKIGFGEAQEFETLAFANPLPGQSIGRKVIEGIEVDTDNNFFDFEPNLPTPNAQNTVYVEVEPPPPPPDPDPVIILIDQVQAEGETVQDEFVKLYNPNETDVDLTGFALKKKTSSGSESNLVSAGSFVGTITAKGYFLIAPQDNEDGTKNYMGLVEPDLRYSSKSASVAFTNTVLLYDGNDILLNEFLVAEPEPDPDPEPDPPPVVEELVVINEIAWMGTTVSANDEWIELYNPGENAVNLLGWKLISADGTPDILLSGIINAHGVYLLERTDDDTVLDIVADQIYTGALGNDGEDISLQDASANVIDQVNSIPWFFGDNETKQTMQRKDPLILGSDMQNWQTSQEVGGTPRF